MSKIEEAMKKARQERDEKDELVRRAPTGPAKAIEDDAPPVRPAGAHAGPAAPGTIVPSAPYVVQSLDKADIDEHVILYHEPKSALAETFRQVRLLALGRDNGAAKTVAFCSANRYEGKSVVSLNFAISVSHDAQGSVLLIDCDMRRPSLHRLLGITPRKGLGDLLSGTTTIERTIMDTPIPRLSFLPAGNPPANPHELVSSDRMERILSELKSPASEGSSGFDYVIFDTPPVLPVADAICLAPQVDGIIFIIEPGRTAKRRVRRALELLESANILGFVFNKGKMMTPDYSYYEDYKYGYSQR